jgi:hypothetical protein
MLHRCCTDAAQIRRNPDLDVRPRIAVDSLDQQRRLLAAAEAHPVQKRPEEAAIKNI